MSTPRIAIVTGAAQGIGRSIALKLADDGLDVAVSDLSSQGDKLDSLVSEIGAKGQKAITIFANATVEKDVEDLVDTTVKELGGLDVMIANAARSLSMATSFVRPRPSRDCRELAESASSCGISFASVHLGIVPHLAHSIPTVQ